MTREEFHLAVNEAKAAYIKVAEDFINALLEDDFEKALKSSLATPEIFGDEVMVYIAREMQNMESYDEISEAYENKCLELSALMMDE